jgi:predicted Zn-dependent protease
MTPQEIVERGLLGDTGFGRVIICEDRWVSNLRWANSTLTTNGETHSRLVTVVAMESGPDGVSAETSTGLVTSLDDVDALVLAARTTARSAPPADDARALPTEPTDTDWDEEPEVSTSSSLTPITASLGAALGKSLALSVELFGYAEQSVESLYLGTSAGVRRRFVQRGGRLEHCGKSHGRTRSAWAGWSGEHLADADVTALDDEVARGLELQGIRHDVTPGRHPVVLSPSATGDLALVLYWNSGARHARDGRSAFSAPHGQTRIGDQLTNVPIMLTSDPHAGGLDCLPFVTVASSGAEASIFDNGLSLQPTRWIDNGRLSTLMASRHEAEQTHIAPTPPIDNLRVDVSGGTGDMWDVAAAMGNGLLVASLWYIRSVDPQTMLHTGLTRDGVYVVSGGEIIGATGNFRFNESPLHLIASIDNAGATDRTLAREQADYFLRTAMPALAVGDFNLSTPSDAI